MTITNPETGKSFEVTRNFRDLTGQTINGKKVIGISHKHNHRHYFDVICSCGRRNKCLAQSITRGNGCLYCSHKGERPERRLRPYEAQYNTFKGRAKHPVSITYDDYLQIAESNTSCHYCDAPIVWREYRSQHSRGGFGSNLDRKDASVGYTVDNVVACCGRCNYAKGTHFSYDQWVRIGKLIKTWHPDEHVGKPTPFYNQH